MDNPLDEPRGPVIEPEVVRPGEDPFTSRTQGPRIKLHAVAPGPLTLLPVLAGAALGVAVGSALGTVLGLLGGPLGIVAGFIVGALVGMAAGAVLGLIFWSLLPAVLRWAIGFSAVGLAAQWVAGRFFQTDLFALISKLLRG